MTTEENNKLWDIYELLIDFKCLLMKNEHLNKAEKETLDDLLHLLHYLAMGFLE